MSGQTTSEYISHHLSFLKTGDGFWNVHFDTLFFSIVSAVIFLFIFSRVAKNATTGVPGKMQCLVEIVVGWVDGIVKENFHGPRNVVAPIALTIFCWVFIMNAIDLIPVDFLPQFAGLFGVNNVIGWVGFNFPLVFLVGCGMDIKVIRFGYGWEWIGFFAISRPTHSPQKAKKNYDQFIPT